MDDADLLPELSELLGAMLFASGRPLTAAEIRKVFQQVAESEGGEAAAFGELKPKDIEAGLAALENGYRGQFIRAQDLFDEMYASLADRSSRRLLNRLVKLDVLLIDELGYVPSGVANFCWCRNSAAGLS